MNKNYVQFTEEMKKDYTILIPNMLPLHFRLVARVLEAYGYKIKTLNSRGPQVAEAGLRYVHNDTCYPAILTIGQFMLALENGECDPHKTALMLFQTGGGCRASNYISLLRKALIKAGMEYIPVISFSFAGIEDHPGFKLGLGVLYKLVYAVLYGDLMMTLVNQVKPYENSRGDADKLADEWTTRLASEITKGHISGGEVRKNYNLMIDDFAKIPVTPRTPVRVGVVGEIYVKYSPLGNNYLEEFLVSEGAEVVMPGLLDFFMYCLYNGIEDYKIYHMKHFQKIVNSIGYRYVLGKQLEIINTIKKDGRFRPMTPFSHTIELVDGFMGMGTKMGEGWLLCAEMLELADEGVPNIVCTQPFGCLPNHICGKGMMKPIKEAIPDVNIVAIDYDASSTSVNQENRIKLMLSFARDNAEKAKGKE